ncbi:MULTISPECIES: CsbD family protein [Pseudomonas]|uniref:CsbD family protein n=1 Tax=Pseudomonas juntendi TaxID=2666183 RepID=A0A7W2QZE7_9PSED|nr:MULTISPECIES: CsbD family protein [Pseudomonas]MBA6133370.1 CsbD family protein [Pseudomonas juntendi]MBA6148601.1 CsbD family protein [Pseudomonas juntendi]MCK2110241.1 CsbD family protein [Pseudomonas juntendi]MCK2118141.1 CsbD family protein [Pseudomonas juntendi]MDG9810739.1 CsbD family protein [Pseudomonas juntendi]
MKREQIEGVAENLAGKAQSAVGRLVEDPALEAEGDARQAAGQVTKTYGDAVDTVTSFVREKPIAALAITAAVTLVISRLLRR